MNTKTLKIRRLEELPSAPLSNVKRFSYSVKSSTLSNLRNKRRKVIVPEEKPVVMTKLPEIDSDTEMRMYEFAQKASAGITMDDVKKKLVVPSTYAPNLQNADNITLENVEIYVEAVKGALHMLENGASIADAKSVCPPNVLFQLVKWKLKMNKLSVVLAPFLHGMRYTSYGRHFTKLDKLQLFS
ncbi:Protein ENHANCED DOWNY MILDEW 2 [Zea mays]|nr:Protein ENHANCED DOWNY MILDEW 2 [Zea mays]